MLLAIDTSTARIGLALYDGTSVPGEFIWHSGLHHTQELAPGLADLLRRVGIKMEAISVLGVAIGPGSFTSLRMGLAFAKGLLLARHLPIVGIPHAVDGGAVAAKRYRTRNSNRLSGCLGAGRTRPSGSRLVQSRKKRMAGRWPGDGDDSR